jgi:drug/metabolite transporter (DMT)-like permease
MMDEWDKSADSANGLVMLVLVMVVLVAAAMLLFGQLMYVQPADAAILFTLPVVVGLLGYVRKMKRRTQRDGFLR